MFKKIHLKRKIIGIIKDKHSNWQDKAIYITSVIEGKDSGEAILKSIIETNIDPKIRKGIASVLGYMDKEHLVPWMIERVFLEEDWTVRFALAHSSSRLIKNKAIEILLQQYKSNIKELEDFKKQQKLKIILVESIGAMAREDGIPILTNMLTRELNFVQKTSFELINHIVYSLGEIGDESVIKYLEQARPSLNNLKKTIGNSVSHSLDKIAKRLGYSSYHRYLQNRDN